MVLCIAFLGEQSARYGQQALRLLVIDFSAWRSLAFRLSLHLRKETNVTKVLKCNDT